MTQFEEIKEIKKIIKKHSQSFYFASLFLPREKKEAIWILYSFCRTIDDLADNKTNNKNICLNKLLEWENDLQKDLPEKQIIINLKKVLLEYKIPLEYPLDLINGCKQDLNKFKYKNFTELADYCYKVASTVGLMSAYIIGFDLKHKTTMTQYAIKAGIALQLTNIVRDIKEDLNLGRIYLPEEEFKLFNCDYNNPDSWRENPEFINLLKLQIQRAKLLYQEGWIGLKYLDFLTAFPIGIALGVYEQILNIIEKNNYEVLKQRFYVSLFEKILLLPILFCKFILYKLLKLC